MSEGRKYDDNYVTNNFLLLFLQFGNIAEYSSFTPIIVTGYSMYKQQPQSGWQLAISHASFPVKNVSIGSWFTIFTLLTFKVGTGFYNFFLYS